jgi:hypothetical protein
MSMSPRQQVDPADDRAEADADPATTSRRRFVRNVGLGAAALGAVAVTGSALTGVASAQTATEPPELSEADITIVRFLQSLLLAAEETLFDAADVPGLESPVAEMIRGFSRNSRVQAAAFGALLESDLTVTTPNPTLTTQVTAQLAGAADQAAVLAIVLPMLEQLCATLQQSLGEAESFLVARVISSVLPIVAQQAAATGATADDPIEEWLPTYGTTAGALAPADYPVS